MGTRCRGDERVERGKEVEALIGEKYGDVERERGWDGGGGGLGIWWNILGVGIKFPRSPSIQGYGLIRYMHCTHKYTSLLRHLNWTF